MKKVKDVRETDIRHLRKLNHENIVKFKGVCSKFLESFRIAIFSCNFKLSFKAQAPVFCIVMEFCPYGPLNQIIQEGAKVITTSRVVSWSKQVAVGMQYLHTHKIIHRDLKSPKLVLPVSLVSVY